MLSFAADKNLCPLSPPARLTAQPSLSFFLAEGWGVKGGCFFIMLGDKNMHLPALQHWGPALSSKVKLRGFSSLWLLCYCHWITFQYSDSSEVIKQESAWLDWNWSKRMMENLFFKYILQHFPQFNAMAKLAQTKFNLIKDANHNTSCKVMRFIINRRG